eukprot:TRINITY_DN1287_c0_g1_i4.p1 TRINITY_DN1287_c0_g1~~TRINITY_DN1287_c0_g1_i4.p1  ORF type:complete len:819 (-),score=157.68 TRINITY_DN1287_c0_g1_i4:215-2671(-)
MTNYLTNVSNLPKNLALLHAKTSKVSDKAKEALDTSGISTSRAEPLAKCSKHQKRIEAFCEKDKELLCISCILEDGHRHHEINSLNIAAERERCSLFKNHDNLSFLEEKMKNMLRQIEEYRFTLTVEAEKSRKEVTSFFNEIRKIVNEREMSLKSRITEQLAKEETSLSQQEIRITEQLTQVTAMIAEITKSDEENDLKLLSASLKRIQMISKATAPIDNLDLYIPFNEINRESEMHQLSKLIIPTKTTSQPVPQKQTSKPITTTAPSRSKPVVEKVKSGMQPPPKQPKGLNNSQTQFYEGSNPRINIYQKASKTAMNLAEGIENRNQDYGQKIERRQISPSPLKINANVVNQHAAGNPQGKHSANFYEIRSLFKERNNERKVHVGSTDIRINHEISEILCRQNPMASVSTPYSNRNCVKEVANEVSEFGEIIGNKTPKANINLTKRAVLPGELSVKGDKIEEKEKVDTQCFNQMEISAIGPERDLALSSGMKSEFNTFIIDPLNTKFMSELYEQNMRIDFSAICQQFHFSIYALGGLVDRNTPISERFDSVKGEWEEVAPIPTSRTKFAAITLPNGRILVMGGKNDGARLSSCEEYDPKDNIWRTSEIQLPVAKSGFGAIIVNDQIIVCGGNDGTKILKTCEAYCLKTKTWRSLAPMKYKRDELSITFGPDRKIYAIGGFGGPTNVCLICVERYDINLGTWEIIANMNTPRRALASVMLPDGVYAIGGFDGHNYLCTVERFDEGTNAWVYINSMNYSRCTHSAINSPDSHHIYVLGGFDNGPLNCVERYSVLTDTWEILAPMKHRRFMHASCLCQKS